MKPIVIIKETNKDGKFELTEKELEELIEQAYEQGYADAKAEYNKPDWIYKDINGGSNDKIYYGNPNNPHDIYGNPIPYCGGSTTGQPNPTFKLNGLTVSTGV